MIDIALAFLRDAYNADLLARTGGQTGAVKLSRVVEDTGRYAIDQDTIGLSLLNIEEERHAKDHTPEYILREGRHVVRPPVLRINLAVLFAANFRIYDQALKHLSALLTYFHTHPCFTRDEHPAQDERLERLIVELQSLSFEQLNQIWAFVGGKHLPAVVYRVRLVVLEPETPAGVQPPITMIRATLGDR